MFQKKSANWSQIQWEANVLLFWRTNNNKSSYNKHNKKDTWINTIIYKQKKKNNRYQTKIHGAKKKRAEINNTVDRAGKEYVSMHGKQTWILE